MKDKIKKILDITETADYKRLSVDEIIVIKDYIIDLQEELDYQKQAEIEYNKKHTKLMKEYKELQERKNKAIKYLEQPYRDDFDYSKAELLNILQGSDE